MLKKPALLLVFFLAFGTVVAQQRRLERAETAYDQYSFKMAQDIYQKVLDRGFENADLLKKLGNAYYFNAEYAQAEEIYGRLVTAYPKETGAEDYFRYAQSLRSVGKYEQADAMMAEFLSRSRAMADTRVDLFKAEPDYLERIEANSGRVRLDTFRFNSPYSDFAPAYYGAELLFSSDRDTGNLARYRHTWNARDFLDLYRVDTAARRAGAPVKLDGVNSRYHESTTAATADGNTLYFTRNNVVENKQSRDASGIVRLKIFRAHKTDGVWTTLEDLPFNSDSYSVAHPTLSPDGKFLYFASDMPGSRGQSDLWRVQILEDGTFGAPENLGPKINTPERETFPFVSGNNVLYFASDGHPGLGGLDIFATKLDYLPYEGSVQNVGRPVNSSMDDFTFILSEDSHKGYFASNRPDGVGDDDIYAFTELEPLGFECIQSVSGTVRDLISNSPLSGATVRIIDENNMEIGSGITDTDGNYEITLDCNQGNFVRATREGYIPSEEYLAPSDGKPRIMDFYLERETVLAGFGDDLAKLLQLSTIYFDFDKYNIRPDAEIEIQKVIAAMEKYPSLKIRAISHTDSRGRDAYNLWLSQKRADATVAYMISKGIAPERLSGKGYGEIYLMNECEDGVPCTEEQHARNRRSEFIIQE
ncbi:OmpA family protein [Robiginitalea sp. M366]|uniref:OmpA family protein n=1 Tax=Robiginitalea aestuariiviva TaxID=3036903 RepID=UPI00240D85F2|nr:OmpA family protein [Robiginitalea aestuariiviva]MDG1570686.1 OmpA family protein [Robiginitalea aestuariiviva]